MNNPYGHMHPDEILYLIKSHEKRIEEIKMWIKLYYSEYKVEPQQAIDSKSYELDNRLRQYYDAMKHKEILVEELQRIQNDNQ